jgi:hypothetical protein
MRLPRAAQPPRRHWGAGARALPLTQRAALLVARLRGGVRRSAMDCIADGTSR